jgi:isopenicillin-N N-acyltransferase-like protein
MIHRRDFLRTAGGVLARSICGAETKESSGRAGIHYFYDFHGSCFDVGFQHGRALRREIRLEVQPSLEAFASRAGISRESALARIVSKYEGLYRERLPALIEEIHGIADGAELSYGHAFFAAVRDGLRTGACSAFACSGKHTSDGRVLIGQTKDTSARLDRFRIMRIAYNSGRTMLILNYPGWIGNFALTSDSVCFTGNTLYTSPPELEGAPGSLLKRLIMETPSVQALLKTIKGMSFGSGSITIADRSGQVVNLECAAGRVGVRDVSGAAFGHANSVLMPELKRYENTAEVCASSKYRQKNLDRLLEAQGGAITVEFLKGLTQDHADFPLSICRHPSPKDGDTTNAAFIADLAAREMHIAIGNPCVAPFRKYSLVT